MSVALADHFSFAFVARNVFWKIGGTSQKMILNIMKSIVSMSHLSLRQPWDNNGTRREKLKLGQGRCRLFVAYELF